MAIYTNNPLNDNTLQYSGLAVFVFAIIYYLIQKNSYCNEKNALCKNPILVNSGIEPNESVVSNSFDSIVQSVKCESLPVQEITTYSTITNKTVAFYALVLTVILGLYLLTTNGTGVIFKDIMFGKISTTDRKAYVNPTLYAGIAFSLLTAITNFIKSGAESESVFLLIIIFIIVSIVFIVFIDNKSSQPSHIKLQIDILIIICIAIGFITITNVRYINNLQIGHAFISSGTYVTIIIQLIIIILMGIALIDNYNTLITNNFKYVLYIIIFITILIQTALFGSHIYNCVWKTYKCTPEISITQEDNDMTKLKISCNANLKFNNSIMAFVFLAILFVILPSEWAIDYITQIFKYIYDAINNLFD